MDNTKPVYNGLHEQPVYLVDTSDTSPELFVIKEFPTQLNAGKNLFKLHGHPTNLREDSSLYIEILDYNNEPIQHEIAELSEEDGSVVIVIYIYETTPPGNCTVTVVGEALYIDNKPVPTEWQFRNNVMWQRDVLVNSSRTNTAEIIFDTKPTLTIQEQISVQLDRKYNTTQTVIYDTGSVQFISNNGSPTLIVNNGEFTPDMIGGIVTITTPQNPSPISKYITGSIPYESVIEKVLSTSSILLRSEYLIDPSQSIYGHRYDQFNPSSYSIKYVATPTYVPTENSESYAIIEINDLQPVSGDIARIKVFSNNAGTVGNWDLLSDVVLGDTEIFITSTSSIEPYVSVGLIRSSSIIDTYYESASYDGFNISTSPNIIYSNNNLTDALYINSTRDISRRNNVDIVKIKDQYAGKFVKGASYKFTLNAIGTRTIATGNTDPIISFYLSGSSFNTDYTDYFNQELPTILGKRIGYLQCKKDKEWFTDNTIIFDADENGTGVLYYVIEGGQWELSNIHVTTNNNPGYTPNYTRIRTKIPTTHKSGVQQSFKVEYYNSQGVKSEHSTISEPIEWVGGNYYIDGDHNLITGSIFVADKLSTGIEFAGRKNSGMIRTVGYTGWNDKKQGIHIWSGSALTSSTTNYNGIGVEMYESDDNYFRFTTDTNITNSLDFRTKTFFLGNSTSSISSNGGDIQISGSISIPGLTLSQVLINGNYSGDKYILAKNGYGLSNYNGVQTSKGIGFDNDSVFIYGGTGPIDDSGSLGVVSVTNFGTINLQTQDNIEYNMNYNGIGSGYFQISGYPGFKGIEYVTDFSASYTNRSLVDKGYVDTAISNSSSTLAEVLTYGSSSGINDIYMGTGTFIRSNNGTGYITLDSNIGNWMQFGVTDTSSYSSIDITDINDNPSVSLRTYDSGNLTAISLASTGILISTYNSGGMFYETDYSGNYQNRSLVDKQYVDNTINTAVSTGTSLYAQTASYYTETDPIFTSLSGSLATTGSNTFTGSQFIYGDLTVYGTASYISVTGSSVNTGNNLITLNTNNPSIRFGGMQVVDTGSFGNSSTGSMLWDSQKNRWIYSNPSGSAYDGGLIMSGPRNTSGVGNEVGVLNNFLTVGQGEDHISSSAIFHSESITQITGSLLVTDNITGSLHGTSSWSNNSITASYITTAETASYILNAISSSYTQLAVTASYIVTAQTASYVLNAISSSYSINAVTSSYINIAQTASYFFTSSVASSSLAQTASYVKLSQTASYVLNAISSSYSNTSTTASYVLNAQTASYVLNAVSSSYSITASTSITARTASYVLNAVSSSYSILAATASYIVLAQTASYVLNAVSSSFATNSTTSTTAQTASYVLNAISSSFATNSLTASYIANVISSSYAVSASYSNTATTASYVLNAQTSSYTISSSFATTANTASYVLNAVSASYTNFASTASYVLNSISSSFASTASYVLNAVSASYSVSSSFATNSATSTTAQTASYVLNAVSASTAATASYFLTSSVTSASLAQTASYVLNAVSSSYSITSSFVPNTFTQNGNSFSTAAILGTNDNQPLRFKTANAVRMQISSSGQIVYGGTAALILSGGLFEGVSPFMEMQTGDAVGTYNEAVVLRHANVDSTAVTRSLGLLMKMSSEAMPSEAPKMGGMILRSTSTYANVPDLHFVTANTEKMTISSAGNVGIGTTAPTNPLHISSSTNQILLSNSSSAWYMSAKSGGDFVIGAQGTRTTLYLGAYSTSGVTSISPLGALTVSSSANSAFIGAGNVGIGTTSPTTLLHVYGATANLVLIERNGGANSHIQYKNTNTAMWAGLSPAGNFAIGNGIDLSINSQLTVVSASGNVGISTTTPNAKLDVNGSAIITGSLNVTAGITGSLFGTASWSNNAITASYIITAQTASYFFTSSVTSASFASTSSYVLNSVSSSLAQTASYFFTASVTSASFATNSATASYFITSSVTSASLAQTASYVVLSQTASYVLNSVSSSFASTASYFLTGSVTSASFAQTASSVNILNQNVSITGSLNVSSSITASVFVTKDALITSTTLTANTGITTIYSIPTASYDGAWFDYTIRSGSNARAGTIFGLWSGSAVNYAENTTTDFGSTANFTFGMSINGSNMILSSSTTTNGWTVNSIIRSV